jgi:hypothetical protein
MPTNKEGNIANIEKQDNIKLRADIIVIKAILGIKGELKSEDLISILKVGEEIERIVAGASLTSQVTFLSEQVNQLKVDEEYILNWQKFSVLISAGFTLESLHQVLNKVMNLEVLESVQIRGEKENLNFAVWYEKVLSGKIELKNNEDRDILGKYIFNRKVDLEKFIKIKEISQKTFIPDTEDAQEEEYLPFNFYLNSSQNRADFSNGYENLGWKNNGITDPDSKQILLDAVQLGVVLKEELKEIMKATANNGSGIDLSDLKLPEILLSVDEN